MVERVRLEDVCDKASSNLAQKDLKEMDGIYPVYGASGYIKDINLYHQDKEYIAIVKDGSVGKTMYLPAKSSVTGTIQYILPKENIIPKYLYFAIKSMDLKKYSTGAIIPHIYFKDYKKEQLLLPSKEDQLKIVSILERIEKIILDREQQILALDTLIKSQFIEMFGMISANEKGFKYATLKELCNKITDGKHGGCQREVKTGYYFVGAKEIYDGIVHYDTAPEISKSDFEKDYKRCNIEKGDFLIVNTGATIGKSAIACDERTEKTLLQKSIALIKTKPNKILPVFLQYCYIVNPSMYKVKSSSAQPNLLLSKINETSIFVPPIELQNQFSVFVHQVDKSKLIIQQNLERLKIFKKSLIQQYFN